MAGMLMVDRSDLLFDIDTMERVSPCHEAPMVVIEGQSGVTCDHEGDHGPCRLQYDFDLEPDADQDYINYWLAYDEAESSKGGIN